MGLLGPKASLTKYEAPGPRWGTSPELHDLVPDIGGFFLSWAARQGLGGPLHARLTGQVNAMRTSDGWVPGRAVDRWFDQSKKTGTVLHYLALMQQMSPFVITAHVSDGLSKADRSLVEQGVYSMLSDYGEGPAAAWAVGVRGDPNPSFSSLQTLLPRAWAEHVAIYDDNPSARKIMVRHFNNWAGQQ